MEKFTESLVKEWSWRLDDGIPDVEDPEKLAVLRQTLVEEHDVSKLVAEEQVRVLLEKNYTNEEMKVAVERVLGRDVSKVDDEDAVFSETKWLSSVRATGDKLLYVRDAMDNQFVTDLAEVVEQEVDGVISATVFDSSGSEIDGSQEEYPVEMSQKAQSSKYPTLWIETDGKSYGIKLSAEGETGKSVKASDFEAGIAIAYNLLNSEGLSAEDADSALDAVDPGSGVAEQSDQVQPVVNAVQDADEAWGSMAPIVSTITKPGIVVVSDSSFDSSGMGDTMQSLGDGWGDMSDEWLDLSDAGSSGTSKSDMASNTTTISLKQSGRSQLMSGGRGETERVFEAAKRFYRDNEDFSDTSVADDILNEVRERMDRFQSDVDLSELKKMIEGPWVDKRKKQLDLSPDKARQQAVFELRLFGVKNKSRGWRDKAVLDMNRSELEDLQKTFVRWTESLVSESDDFRDEIADLAVAKMNESKLEDTIKDFYQANEEFAKWCVFEAATGMYKFNGTTDMGSYPTSLPSMSAEKGMANTMLVFSTGSGVVEITDIDRTWASKNSRKVDVEMSFKEASGSRYIAQRLVTVTESKSRQMRPIEAIVRECVNHEMDQAARKLNYSRNRMIEEGVFTDAWQSIKSTVKRVTKLVFDTIRSAVGKVAGRIYDVVRETIDRGISAVLRLLGYEVEGTAQVNVEF